MSTKDKKDEPLTAEQVSALWDEEAAKLVAPVAEAQPTTEIVADAPAADAAPAKADPVAEADPMAGLPEVLRTKLEGLDKLTDRLRNIEGHIGGLTNGQKQLKDLLTASKEVADKVTDAPTQAEVKAAIQTPEKWNALKAEYSEWADAVESFVDSRIAGAAPAKAIDSAAVDELVDAKLAKLTPTIRKQVVEDYLEGEFGKWKDEVKTKPFTDWFSKQAEEVKSLADSASIGDAAKLLRLYHKPANVAVESTDPGAEIAAERKQKLDAAADALPKGSQKPVTKSTEDMTAAELWEYEAEQRRKKKSA